jgi:transposase
MTNPTSNVPIEPVSEILEGVERRRRWSAEEKLRIVEETEQPGKSVSLVARRYGLAANQVFKWKRLIRQGGLSAVTAEEEVVPASEYRALQQQVRELQRVLGKKTMEADILREALDVQRPKKLTSRALHAAGGGSL